MRGCARSVATCRRFARCSRPKHRPAAARVARRLGSRVGPWLGAGLAAFVTLGPAIASARAAEEGCAAWAGEPSPLPTATDPDPSLSRWAELRARELRKLASAWMPRVPATAAALLAHARCLDPGAGSTAQDPPVRVTREPVETREATPSLLAAPAAPPALELRARPKENALRAHPEENALRPLTARAILPTVSAPPPSTPVAPRARPPDTSAASRIQLPAAGTAAPGRTPRSPGAAPARDPLAPIRAAVRGARFEEALARVDGVRPRLREPRARAELEVLAATASLALGRDRDARRQFAAALRADPDLRLDPFEHSPKLRALFAAVRAERGEP